MQTILQKLYRKYKFADNPTETIQQVRMCRQCYRNYTASFNVQINPTETVQQV